MSAPYSQPPPPGASAWRRRLAQAGNHGPGPLPTSDGGPGKPPAARWSWKGMAAFGVVWVLWASDAGPAWVPAAVAVAAGALVAGGEWGFRVSGPDAPEWKVVTYPLLAVLIAVAGVLVFATDADDSTVAYGVFVVGWSGSEIARGLRVRLGGPPPSDATPARPDA